VARVGRGETDTERRGGQNIGLMGKISRGRGEERASFDYIIGKGELVKQLTAQVL